VLDENGCTFNALHHSRPRGHIQLYAFDLLVHRGRNVLCLPVGGAAWTGEYKGKTGVAAPAQFSSSLE
jgi:hypothetical protein